MRVLISGAGIAGPTLAYFLSKAGIQVMIVEKSTAILPHGQNVDLKGSAVTAIRKMGLLEKVRQLNTGEVGTRFIDPKGKPYALFPQDGNSASPTAELEILRGDLAKVLYEASKDLPNVEYLLGATISKVLSNSEKGVEVELSNGECQSFDLLVAADGQWSKIRQQCFAPEAVKPVDLSVFAAYYTVPRLPTDNDWWNVYHAPRSGIVATRPDPYDTIRSLFVYMPKNDLEKETWRVAARSGRKAQLDLLKAEFADAGWEAQRLLDAAGDSPDFYFQDLQQIKMTKWSNKRIVCLGDAAYCPTALTGMGTTLAVTGAYMLAGELSLVKTSEDISRALDNYERRYRPFVEQSQQLPWFIPNFFLPASPGKIWLLQCGISMLSKVLPILGVKTGPSEQDDDGFPLPEYPAFSCLPMSL